MKFFNIDLHISVISDIKRIFNDLGHDVDDLCLSGHHWVMNRKKDSVKLLDNDKWTRLVWDWKFEEFYNTHKDSLKKYDGFIVTYPPIFGMLYDKFDKPIIIQIPIRYDYAVHGCPERLGKFNEWLRNGVKSGKVILVSNSKYDSEYCRILSGLTPKHIPNLCEYFPKRNVMERNNFVLYQLGCSFNSSIPQIIDRSIALPNGWNWNNLHKYKAVVHMPYQVSTMSVFEQYTANVPMIFPSKKALKEMYFGNCYDVLSQVSTYKMSNKKIHKTVIPINGDVDPNDWTSEKTVDLWLDNADFNDSEWMPYITYFDNLTDLKSKINNDFEGISMDMELFNAIRKQKVYSMWDNLLKGIV